MKNLVTATFAVASLVTSLSCGGGTAASEGTVGTSHATKDTDDVDSVEVDSVNIDAGVEEAPPAAVTFVLNNESSSEDLVLNMDKGWQPVIFAYSGEPPNAKPILMFPTHCTSSCDVPKEEVCPYCPELERVKDIRAAEKQDHVTPGDTREVPWDGQVFQYKKTRGVTEGKKSRCKCYSMEEAEPATYTVRACGLRLTKTAKATSKYECVEGSMTWPSDEPVRVELNFGG